MKAFLAWCSAWLVAISLIAGTGRAATAPLSDAEVSAFGHELVDLFNAGKGDEIDHRLDLLAVGSRAVEGIDITEKQKTDAIAGLVEGLRRSFSVSLKRWTKAHFVRVHEVDGAKRAYLRVLADDGSFNFFDVVCARTESGGVKGVDLHICMTGELMSETLHRALLPVLLELNKSLWDQLTTADGAYVKSMPVVQQASQHIQQGKGAEALTELATLPPEVRTQRMVLLLRLAASQHGAEDAYLAIIEEWEKMFPNDPTLDAISIDGCFLRKDYAGASAHLVSLQKTTGPDGYLEILHASMQRLEGQHDAAVVTIRHAVEIEPSLFQAYDVWFDLELKAANWKGVVTALQTFETAFPKADLWHLIKTDAGWADFRASHECRAWRETMDQPVAEPARSS